MSSARCVGRTSGGDVAVGTQAGTGVSVLLEGGRNVCAGRSVAEDNAYGSVPSLIIDWKIDKSIPRNSKCGVDTLTRFLTCFTVEAAGAYASSEGGRVLVICHGLRRRSYGNGEPIERGNYKVPAVFPLARLVYS